MPKWNKISDEKRLAIWQAWKEESLTYGALAARFKLSKSAVYHALKDERGKRHPKVLVVAPQPPTTTALALHSKHAGRGEDRASRQSAIAKRQLILSLRAQGLTVNKIADQLNMKPSAVNHYIYTKQSAVKPNGGGHVTNGSLNKNVAVGIVYAEVERFISAISQRLGVAPAVLRPKLSELLGRSPFRG